MLTDLDWNNAETHLRTIMGRYGELVGKPGVNPMPALVFVMQPLLKRFLDGERTEELHDEMMGAE